MYKRQLLSLAEARSRDMQQELDENKTSINDLILEIEAVSGEEPEASQQNSRLLRQMSECQSTQRVALADSQNLQSAIEVGRRGGCRL